MVTPTCPKIAYPAKKEAKKALLSCKAAADSGQQCRVEQRFYRCPRCNCFHLTKMTETEYALTHNLSTSEQQEEHA